MHHEKKTFIILRKDSRRRTVRTVDEVIDYLGHGFYQNKILLFCGMIVAANSMQTFLMTFVAPMLQCEWYISDYQMALISSADSMGMVVFSLVTGYLSDNYGRRACLLLTTALWGIASTLSAFSPTPIWMFVLRFLLGGGSSSYVQAYPYALENLPTNNRRLIVFLKMMWAIGGLVCSLIAILFLHFLSERWLILTIASSAFFVVMMLFNVTETPKFYEITGQHDKLVWLLRRISETNHTPLPHGYVLATSGQYDNRGDVRKLWRPPLIRWTIIFTLLHLSSGLLYFGLVYLAVLDLEYIVKDGQVQDDGIRCRPCSWLTSHASTEIIISSMAEVVANPITYYAVKSFGERAVVACLGIPGALILFSLLIPGYLYTIRLVLMRMIAAGLVIISFTVSPLYFTPLNRGIAAGTFNIAFRVGAIVAPFIVQVLLKIELTLAVHVLVVVTIVAGLTSIFLPSKSKGSAKIA